MSQEEAANLMRNTAAKLRGDAALLELYANLLDAPKADPLALALDPLVFRPMYAGLKGPVYVEGRAMYEWAVSSPEVAGADGYEESWNEAIAQVTKYGIPHPTTPNSGWTTEGPGEHRWTRE